MDYRSIIESRYNRANWQELLHDIFRNNVQFWQQPQSVLVDAAMAKRALYLGKITLPDGHVIAIYEVELSDTVVIERNRAGIRNLLCANWRGMGCAGAFMFCYRENESVLRFSYVSETYTFAEDGSLAKESTDTKRFTYLLGEGHRSRTAIKQFEDLKNSALDLKAITKAFSVEALSDRFFEGYKRQYEDIIEYVTGKRMVKVANKWEEQVKHAPCQEIMQEFAQFPDAEKAVRDYVKKLMGRLVFIQFLQKKGWMGCSAGEAWNNGDREFVQNLFANTSHKDTFVDDVLEPLFNDINTKRADDLASSANVGKGIKIPYLNGGLFESDDYDKTCFPLPAKYMQSILDFFASYNFTIDENDPDDAEIGVDPEMLGRIFENLLEDNKDKGAFYTPKEIVQYMCRESLIAYLQTDLDDETAKESVRQFVAEQDASALPEQLRDYIDQKLRDVKICDPAIGSGAFPMGLLRELYACRKAIEGIDDDTAVRIKTDIIQNNIYGVDIEKGAVDIARLRFWLALIVDEKNPHALPNMDFKIMQGNSLLEQYEGVDLSGMSLNEQKRKNTKKGQAWQQTFVFDEEDALKNIQGAIKEYYLTDDHQSKQKLRGIINDNVRSYIVNLKGCTSDIQSKIDALPIPNDKFFLWHIYFKEVFDKGGFDIVIGNPPYLESRSSNFAESLKVNLQNEIKTRRQEDSSAFPRGADLLIFFYELSLRLLNKNGYNVFITENSWLSTDYGKLFQNFLLKRCVVHAIIDSDYKYFETADINTVITLFKNRNGEDTSLPVKFFHCNGSLAQYPCNTTSNSSNEHNSLRLLMSDDKLLHNFKWSVVTRAEQKLLDIIDILSTKEDKNIASKIRIGQGLNLTKKHILTQYSSSTFPYYTSELGSTYSWNDSTCFVSKNDISKGREKPLLILPRGIGTHFCSLNKCCGFTSSYVEVYGKLSHEESMNIWLFCNSSLFWLLREITGRTNLGGGMLKAEATDLKSIPICFNFSCPAEIDSIYNTVKDKKLSTDISETLSDQIHNRIDTIVCNYFGLENDMSYIKTQLIACVEQRIKKSKTK